MSRRLHDPIVRHVEDELRMVGPKRLVPLKTHCSSHALQARQLFKTTAGLESKSRYTAAGLERGMVAECSNLYHPNVA